MTEPPDINDNREETHCDPTFVTSKGMSISVTEKCLQGVCCCTHKLGLVPTQLKPCRFAAKIFVNPQPPKEDLCVFDIVCHGVDIVAGDEPSYECKNYDSILQPMNRAKMDVIISDELASGALSIVTDKPHCDGCRD